MKNYIPILKNNPMFRAVREEEIGAMLSCLNARKRSYKKGECVLRQGDSLSDILILVSGDLSIHKDDYWGKRSILSRIGVGEMFGEAYAIPQSGPVLYDVLTLEDSVVLFFDVKRILTTCSSACRFHTLVVQNLFFGLSWKNKNLVQKITYLSARTTREKLILYLSEESKKQRSGEFSIPFNRQELADFLSVDRSAMSAELSKMKKDGLLNYHKNQFRLL